jgi:hypothetical protein
MDGKRSAGEQLHGGPSDPSSSRRRCQRQGAALASQETVEAAWRVVDPVLGDVVPVHPYDRGTWGPGQASNLLPPGEAWHDPAD